MSNETTGAGQDALLCEDEYETPCCECDGGVIWLDGGCFSFYCACDCHDGEITPQMVMRMADDRETDFPF
jgi:hypothetical protein